MSELTAGTIETLIPTVPGCMHRRNSGKGDQDRKLPTNGHDQARRRPMPNCSESHGKGKAARCAVCDGKFGLVRYYSWRTPLCSRRCVDRFKARREADRNWLPQLQMTFYQPAPIRVRAL